MTLLSDIVLGAWASAANRRARITWDGQKAEVDALRSFGLGKASVSKQPPS